MHVTHLIVGGFKSIRETVTVPLAPITLLFGPNSAGKSTLKRAWSFLQERLDPARGRMTREGAFLSRDTPHPLAHRLPKPLVGTVAIDEQSASLPITLGIRVADFSWDAGIEEVPGLPEDGLTWLSHLGEGLRGKEVEWVVTEQGRGHWCQALELVVDGEPLFTCEAYPFDEDPIPASWLAESPPLPGRTVRLTHLGRATWNVGHPVLQGGRISELAGKLIQASKAADDAWLSSVVSMEGRTLTLRLDGPDRELLSWMSSFGRFDEDPEPWEADGHIGNRFPEATRFVDELRALTNAALRQVELNLLDALRFNEVGGGRSLLRPEDLQARLDERWLTMGAPWRPRHFPVLCGALQAELISDAHIASLGASVSFVNEELSGPLFGRTPYRLEPTLRRVTTTTLCTSDADEESDEPASELVGQLSLRDGHGRLVSIEDVGSGISYVYPILTALAAGGLSWIEQPELHLHPAAQCELGDVFVRAFNHQQRRGACILETHSEHMLLRMLRRMRETQQGAPTDRSVKLRPEAVNVLYFEPRPDGHTVIHHLRVSADGEFVDDWPHGFFEERAKELFDE